MESQKMLKLNFFLSLLLSGFFAGIGFFTAIGFNPALAFMTDSTFAECWQHLDHYKGMRMPAFGLLLLLFVLTNILLLGRFRKAAAFWSMIMAFVFLLADITFTLSVNHPLNELIQSWDLNMLPSDVGDVRQQVINAFNVRICFMMGVFVAVIVSAYSSVHIQSQSNKVQI